MKEANSKLKLKVYYGWAKQNKIRKREAISIIFQNSQISEDKILHYVNRIQDTVYVRLQTPGEASDGAYCNRILTEYSIFMDHNKIKGSLNKALEANYISDSLNVDIKTLESIKEALKGHYLNAHKGYKEPVNQLTFQF